MVRPLSGKERRLTTSFTISPEVLKSFQKLIPSGKQSQMFENLIKQFIDSKKSVGRGSIPSQPKKKTQGSTQGDSNDK